MNKGKWRLVVVWKTGDRTVNYGSLDEMHARLTVLLRGEDSLPLVEELLLRRNPEGER